MLRLEAFVLLERNKLIRVVWECGGRYFYTVTSIVHTVCTYCTVCMSGSSRDAVWSPSALVNARVSVGPFWRRHDATYAHTCNDMYVIQYTLKRQSPAAQSRSQWPPLVFLAAEATERRRDAAAGPLRITPSPVPVAAYSLRVEAPPGLPPKQLDSPPTLNSVLGGQSE